jgi:hypothetical protein
LPVALTGQAGQQQTARQQLPHFPRMDAGWRRGIVAVRSSSGRRPRARRAAPSNRRPRSRRCIGWMQIKCCPPPVIAQGRCTCCARMLRAANRNKAPEPITLGYVICPTAAPVRLLGSRSDRVQMGNSVQARRQVPCVPHGSRGSVPRRAGGALFDQSAAFCGLPFAVALSAERDRGAAGTTRAAQLFLPAAHRAAIFPTFFTFFCSRHVSSLRRLARRRRAAGRLSQKLLPTAPQKAPSGRGDYGFMIGQAALPWI